MLVKNKILITEFDVTDESLRVAADLPREAAGTQNGLCW